jgi:hypothetical protein
MEWSYNPTSPSNFTITPDGKKALDLFIRILPDQMDYVIHLRDWK